jgi:hypothetical protein
MESARVRPAQVHAQQHLRPVLRLGASRPGLDIEKRPARVHLAGKHPRQLELPDTLLECAGIAIHYGKPRLVLLVFDQVQELAGLGQSAADPVELADRGREPGALTAEFLCPLRVVPDPGVTQFAIEFV